MIEPIFSIPFAREIPTVNCFVQAFKQEEAELNITDVFEDYNNELVSKYVDICYTYLKEDILFVDSFAEDNKSNMKEFDKVRKSYLRNSNWNSLLVSNNIKGSIK